jgi:membrane-associated phospholipid phosphatase
MKKWIQSYKEAAQQKNFLFSIAGVLILLGLSLVTNFYAGQYARVEASNPVTDLILNNIPVFNVDGFFIYGPILFWIFVIYLGVSQPKRIPFLTESVALLMLIRCVFVSLTHIGPFPDHLYVQSTFFSFITSGSDLFFSGHTAFPFLMCLIFWDNKKLRWLFFLLSLFFGAIVLMGHLHYSIDVLAAFFITYTTVHLAKTGFRKDWYLFAETVK